jgi:urocanate hydratase
LLTGLRRFEDKAGYSDTYSRAMQEYLDRLFPIEYKALWEMIEKEKIPAVVCIGDLVEVIYNELEKNVVMDLVGEAIQRGDHEIHGYSPETFQELAYSGQIKDEAITPDISFRTFSQMLLQYLNNNQILYETYEGKMLNIPIVEVW